MRLAFTSDLHVDHHPEVVGLVAARVRAAGAQVLVIAGDVSARRAVLEDVLAELGQAAPTVVFVAGNHDLWCDGGETSRTRYLETLPALCERAGVECLHGGPLVLAALTLAGQTGWYDYSLRDTSHDHQIPESAYREGRYGRLAWSDRRFVSWPGASGADLSDVELTEWMALRLADDLDEAPRDRPMVVVTHMLPFAELVLPVPMPWAFVRGFLGSSRLGQVIRDAATAGAPIARVISGHTHFARTATIDAGDRHIVCETSPIGYPREYRTRGDLEARVASRVRVVDVSPEDRAPRGEALA